MKYSFRRGPIYDDERIEVTRSSLKYFNGAGAAKREVAFSDIKALHGFSNMSAYNEKGEPFETHMIKLVPKTGRSIVVCSSTFKRHGSGYRQVAEDNSKQYIRLLIEIKKNICAANPDALLVEGNLIAAILGYLCALLGLGLLLAVVFMTLSSPAAISEGWPIILLVVVFCLVFIPWGIVMGKSYWPKKGPIR